MRKRFYLMLLVLGLILLALPGFAAKAVRRGTRCGFDLRPVESKRGNVFATCERRGTGPPRRSAAS
jgi:hypothetical protein